MVPPLSQTSAEDTAGKLLIDVNDGSGNSIGSVNGQLSTADIINTSLTTGAITVSTTAVAARVGASNLTNRKMLMITPLTQTIYIGGSATVTTTTGTPIFPNQTISFAFGAGITPFLISSVSGSVVITEGA